MTYIKGTVITFTGNLMMPLEIRKANEFLKQELGTTHLKLNPEGWYDVRVFDQFLRICAENSRMKDEIYTFIGKKVYPTAQKMMSLPANLKTPADYILFEMESFLAQHQGDEVVPRRLIKNQAREIVIQAKAPGYNSKIFKGIYLGLLELSGVTTGKVEHRQDDIFVISW